MDPQINLYEQEVQKIVQLQSLANQLPDALADPKRVTKSHIPVVNVPIHVDVPEGQDNNKSQARMKRKRPLGSKDKNPRKRKLKQSK